MSLRVIASCSVLSIGFPRACLLWFLILFVCVFFAILSSLCFIFASSHVVCVCVSLLVAASVWAYVCMHGCSFVRFHIRSVWVHASGH